MEGRTTDLSPREREVLELVRQGLTNDQIAERLGITSDGVKYHVSQVLSKLGVSSRHEAVAAVFPPRRRGRWETLVASTALRVATAAGALVVLIFVVFLLVAVLSSGGDGASPDVSNLTVDSVVTSVAKAATRPGQVLHTRISAKTTHQSTAVPYYATELWIDAARETVRYEYRLDPASYRYDQATESTAILAGIYSYVQVAPAKPTATQPRPLVTERQSVSASAHCGWRCFSLAIRQSCPELLPRLPSSSPVTSTGVAPS